MLSESSDARPTSGRVAKSLRSTSPTANARVSSVRTKNRTRTRPTPVVSDGKTGGLLTGRSSLTVNITFVGGRLARSFGLSDVDNDRITSGLTSVEPSLQLLASPTIAHRS